MNPTTTHHQEQPMSPQTATMPNPTGYTLTKALLDVPGAVRHLEMGLEDARATVRIDAQGNGADKAQLQELEQNLDDVLYRVFELGGEDLAGLAEATVDCLHRLGHLLSEAADKAGESQRP